MDGVEFTRRFRTAAAIMEWCDDLSVRFSGDPRTQHVDEEHAADAHRPPYLVLPLDMYIMQGSRLLDVVISSFGAAGFRGSKNDEAIFTARRVAYAAPELRLAAQHQHDGMSSDIWSLACIFFEMRLQRPCFVDFSSETGRVEQVAELERIFGPLPAMCRKQVLRVLAQPLYAEEGQEAVHKRARDYVEGKTDLPPFVALRYVKDFDSSGSGLYAFATLDDWIQRACLAAAKSGLPTALLRSIGRVSEYEVAGLTREAAWGLYGVEWEYRGDEMWVEIEAARVSPLPSSLPGSPAGASSQRLPKSAKAQKPSSAVAPKTSEAPVRRSERIRAKNEARVGAKASSTSIPKLAKPGRNKKAKGVSQDPPAASDSKKEAPSPGTPAHRRQIKEKRRASQSSRSPGTGSDAAVGSGPAPEERRIGWEHGSLLCYREQDGHPDPEKPRSSRAWEDIERMLRTDALRVDSGRVRGRRGHDGTLFEFQVPEAEARVFGDLMGKMMKVDPGERIDIEEVLDHGWFDDNRLVGYLAKLQGPLDDSFPKRAQSFNEWLEYMYDVKKRWM